MDLVDGLAKNGKMTRNQMFFPAWLRFFIITLLLLGVFFRFVNLDLKVYWTDEVINTQYSSGYTEVELWDQVKAWNCHDISITSLHNKFQFPNPEKSSIDVIKALAIDEPQNPPLYYLLSRWWMQLFGDSVAVRRSLSACISLLAFPCIYWLCLELFESSLTGWIAIALLAVSPLHVLYAQEVRPYGAWTVTILLSSAALLWAMRLKTKLHWGTYAATLTLGLYTFTLSGLFAIGHGVYVAIVERFRLSKTVISYLLASLAGIMFFSPWLILTIIGFSIGSSEMSDWRQREIPLFSLINSWVLNLSLIFIDVTRDRSQISTLEKYLLIPLLLVMVGYSIYFLCRNTPQRVWLFILTLIGVPWLALTLPDLIVGGVRSSVPRYLIPSYLGIQLAVAYLFATKITSISASVWRQKLWQIAMIALISSGVLSCTISSQSASWWNKYQNSHNPPIASIVNRANHPLLLSEFTGGRSIVSLSYLLDPKVRLLLWSEPNIPKIPDSFSDVFLLDPSEELLDRIENEQNFKVEPVYKSNQLSLWKLGR